MSTRSDDPSPGKTPRAGVPRPRLLVTCSTFPRWPDDEMPDFVARLVAALADDFRVTVLAPHHAGAKRVQRWGRSVIVRYPYLWPAGLQRLAYGGGILPNIRRSPLLILQFPLLLLAGAWATRRLLAGGRYDLIHAHWVIPQGVQLRLATLGVRHRPPLVVTSHGGDLFSFRRGPVAWIKRWAVRGVDAATVVSQAMLPLMRGLGIRGPIEVIPMGTETARFEPPPEPSPLAQILFVGRLSEKKGVDVALSALARLSPEQAWSFTIVGDGPRRPQLEALADRLGIGARVHFLGWRQRQQLPDLFRQHGTFLFPSIETASGDQEGFGLTLAEAMASGCAVIASDLPAVGDLAVDAETALVFPAGDPDALAARIAQLLADPERAVAMRARGRSRVEQRFSMAQTARSYKALFRACLQSAPVDG